MKINNPEQAVIPFEKLEGYALNPHHAEGRHKAVLFQSRLGIGLEDAEELRSILRQALIDQEVTPTTRNPYGQKYQLDFEITRNDKSAMIRSIWIVRNQEDFPRLITCYLI